jgi:hypothetical protein
MVQPGKTSFKSYEVQARLLRAIVAAHPEVKWNHKGKAPSYLCLRLSFPAAREVVVNQETGAFSQESKSDWVHVISHPAVLRLGHDRILSPTSVPPS